MIKFYLRLIRFFSSGRLAIENSNYGTAASDKRNLSFGRFSRRVATVRLAQKNGNGRSNKLNISRQHGESCEPLNLL